MALRDASASKNIQMKKNAERKPPHLLLPDPDDRGETAKLLFIKISSFVIWYLSNTKDIAMSKLAVFKSQHLCISFPLLYVQTMLQYLVDVKCEE